ncbi:proline-rich receptor-like protein kinase PERK1 [Fagus crenata]
MTSSPPPSPPPITGSPQRAPISFPPPPSSLPPLISPPLSPTPTQPIISPPPPPPPSPSPKTTPSPPPPPTPTPSTTPLPPSSSPPPPSTTPLPLPPPSATPNPPIAPAPLPSQPPTPTLTPPFTSPPSPHSPPIPTPPFPPKTSPPRPPSPPETWSPPPPTHSPLLPITPPLPPPPTSTLTPPPPTTITPIGSPPPLALASPPASSPQPPKSFTSPPLAPPTLESQSLPAKHDSGQFHTSRGLMIGCVIGVILLVIIVFGILFVCCQYRRKKKHVPSEEDYYKLTFLPPNGERLVALPQHPQKNTPLGSQIHMLLPNTCPLPPRMRSNGGSGFISSGFVNPILPQAPGVALGFSCAIFTYDQLMVATNGFSEANLLGEGGFGYVHKGVLPNGQEIAVKQLKTDSHQGEREFQAEVETISRVNHKHLVSLVGYCITGAERLLAYEFVPNKTLEFHLHGKEQPVMDWADRMKIAIGSAKGLAYLHEDCNPKIIHRDIKASNILLDFRFEAKVSDFGLAKIFSDARTNIYTRVVGTIGYLAPEYASSGKVTDKSDVYSYGVMLLELITGRPPIIEIGSSVNQSLVEYARPLLSQALDDGNFDALVDPRLLSNFNTSEMTTMVACAANCVRHSESLRPRMSQIVHALEGHVSLKDLDEGMQPGDSTSFNFAGRSNCDVRKYFENMKKSNMTLESQEYGMMSRYSGSTSEYGLNPSDSSSEFPQRT